MDIDRVISALNAGLLPNAPLIENADLTPDWEPEGGLKGAPVPSAVLIPLISRGQGYSVLYTLRSSLLRSHAAQVSFPGGRIEPDDESEAAAALRECNEEIGLLPQNASVVGYMSHYFTGTNYLITPVVGIITDPSGLKPNPDEVDTIFEVPLAHILSDTSFARVNVRVRQQTLQSREMIYEGHRIWGITANITYRLREIILNNW